MQKSTFFEFPLIESIVYLSELVRQFSNTGTFKDAKLSEIFTRKEYVNFKIVEIFKILKLQQGISFICL